MATANRAIANPNNSSMTLLLQSSQRQTDFALV